MRLSLTIAIKADGKVRLLAGPEVPVKEQSAKMAEFKQGGIPGGVVRIERWESDSGRVQVALPRPSAAVASTKSE